MNDEDKDQEFLRKVSPFPDRERELKKLGPDRYITGFRRYGIFAIFLLTAWRVGAFVLYVKDGCQNDFHDYVSDVKKLEKSIVVGLVFSFTLGALNFLLMEFQNT
jgi:hypothetical protein